MTIDGALISYAVKYGDITALQQAGIDQSYFVDEWRTVWKYLTRTKRDHDTVPSKDTLRSRFPDLELPRVQQRDLPLLIVQARQRRKFIDFLTSVNNAVNNTHSPESVDDVIQQLQGELNRLAFSPRQQSHLVDLFSPEISKRIRREIRQRKSGEVQGIPTGLATFDRVAGGLQKQKMYVAIGRPGIGKSWLDLLFVAVAVINGYKVILYPLEMNLFETATRLYSIFTSQLFGPQRALKNYDLTSGNVNMRKVVRFLHTLEDKFAGQLYVADVAALADPYTVERIEAEVEVQIPDMFWIDYITLLKAPPSAKNGGDDWSAVRGLSNGVKNIAMRRNCVGGVSAQVNREAMRTRVFLPRLEHIAYGDSIGQDADGVFSLNRNKDLYYALVKHRGGFEIGKTRVAFDVNSGHLAERPEEGEDDG